MALIDDLLSKQDTYSMTMLMILACSDNPRYATLNELPFVLNDQEQFLRFIKYYAGQTIQIPTMQEICDSLRLLTLFQYYVVENKPWKDAIKEAGFSPEESHTAKMLLNSFKKQIRRYNYQIGGLLNK